jgi:hypothetical protein
MRIQWASTVISERVPNGTFILEVFAPNLTEGISG